MDETNKLLCEIRDAIVRREEAYKEYLETSNKNNKEATEKFNNAFRNMIRNWAIMYWVATFAIVYFAVLLAMSAK